MVVRDGVGDSDYGDGAIVLQLDLALLEEAIEDVSGILVVRCILLGLRELFVQLLDLILLLSFEDVGECVDLHLFLEISLCAAALGAGLEEVGAGAIRR